MGFLLQTLHRLSLVSPADQPERAPVPQREASAETEPGLVTDVLREALPTGITPGPLESPDDRVLSGHVKTVFRIWIVLFGLVGSQMGWVLRPFIGDPNTPFTWFRVRESNVFQGILNALGNLFSG
jgi:hypothetical protein